MVKPLTIYEASDGSRHDTRQDAETRDSLVDRVRLAMEPLGDEYEDVGCSFGNGSGYIQHDHHDVQDVKLALFEITKEHLGSWVKRKKAEPGITDYYLATQVSPEVYLRLLDGSCKPLEAAYSRLYCIDNQYREWGQPYFALNPLKGEQVKLR